MITNEEARKAIEKYQKEHPLQFGVMLDVTAISSKEGTDIISQTIEKISKKVEEDTDLWCICEMAKMYMQGVRPVYPVRTQSEWIPITYRPMTTEERIKLAEYCGVEFCDTSEEKAFDCPMPEDKQEILISTSWGVVDDVADNDIDGEGFIYYGLEENGDWDGVDAWMPKPKPYKKGGEES